MGLILHTLVHVGSSDSESKIESSSPVGLPLVYFPGQKDSGPHTRTKAVPEVAPDKLIQDLLQKNTVGFWRNLFKLGPTQEVREKIDAIRIAYPKLPEEIRGQLSKSGDLDAAKDQKVYQDALTHVQNHSKLAASLESHVSFWDFREKAEKRGVNKSILETYDKEIEEIQSSDLSEPTKDALKQSLYRTIGLDDSTKADWPKSIHARLKNASIVIKAIRKFAFSDISEENFSAVLELVLNEHKQQKTVEICSEIESILGSKSLSQEIRNSLIKYAINADMVEGGELYADLKTILTLPFSADSAEVHEHLLRVAINSSPTERKYLLEIAASPSGFSALKALSTEILALPFSTEIREHLLRVAINKGSKIAEELALKLKVIQAWPFSTEIRERLLRIAINSAPETAKKEADLLKSLFKSSDFSDLPGPVQERLQRMANTQTAAVVSNRLKDLTRFYHSEEIASYPREIRDALLEKTFEDGVVQVSSFGIASLNGFRKNLPQTLPESVQNSLMKSFLQEGSLKANEALQRALQAPPKTPMQKQAPAEKRQLPIPEEAAAARIVGVARGYLERKRVVKTTELNKAIGEQLTGFLTGSGRPLTDEQRLDLSRVIARQILENPDQYQGNGLRLR